MILSWDNFILRSYYIILLCIDYISQTMINLSEKCQSTPNLSFSSLSLAELAPLSSSSSSKFILSFFLCTSTRNKHARGERGHRERKEDPEQSRTRLAIERELQASRGSWVNMENNVVRSRMLLVYSWLAISNSAKGKLSIANAQRIQCMFYLISLRHRIRQI